MLWFLHKNQPGLQRVFLRLQPPLNCVQTLSIFRQLESSGRFFSHKYTKCGSKEAENRRSNHYQRSGRKGFFVGDHGGIDNLNNRALPRLVEPCDFEFFRQQLEHGFFVLKIAIAAEVFHPRLSRSSLGEIEIRGVIMLRSPEPFELQLECSKLLL